MFDYKYVARISRRVETSVSCFGPFCAIEPASRISRRVETFKLSADYAHIGTSRISRRVETPRVQETAR